MPEVVTPFFRQTHDPDPLADLLGCSEREVSGGDPAWQRVARVQECRLTG
jgi:hypothetical protein